MPGRWARCRSDGTQGAQVTQNGGRQRADDGGHGGVRPAPGSSLSTLVAADSVLAGERHLRDPATALPCADSSTICARRQVTTDPLSRRTIRTSRRPSSSSISPPAHARRPAQFEGSARTRPAPGRGANGDRLRR
jgi:hypothetical protein